MVKLPGQAPAKRKKSPRPLKARDRRTVDQRIAERDQRIGRARLLERLSAHAAETRDAAP